MHLFARSHVNTVYLKHSTTIIHRLSQYQVLQAAHSDRAQHFVSEHWKKCYKYSMLSKGQTLLLVVFAVAVFGTVSVEGAALNRTPRQLSSLLTLSGESNARIENGTILCDTLKCPPESFKCVIVKNSTKDDVNKIQVTRECLDPAGKATAKNVTTETSSFPGQQFESYAEIDKNGNIASFDNRGNTYNHSGSGDIHSYLYEQIEDLHKAILDQLTNAGNPFTAQ